MNTTAIRNAYLFTGRQFDEEAGLYYYRARHYSPELKKFIQRDPLEYVDGPSALCYTNASPIRKLDPAGLSGEPPFAPSVEGSYEGGGIEVSWRTYTPDPNDEHGTGWVTFSLEGWLNAGSSIGAGVAFLSGLWDLGLRAVTFTSWEWGAGTKAEIVIPPNCSENLWLHEWGHVWICGGVYEKYWNRILDEPDRTKRNDLADDAAKEEEENQTEYDDDTDHGRNEQPPAGVSGGWEPSR